MDISSKPNYMFKGRIIDYFFVWRWWAAQVAFLPMAAASLYVAVDVVHASLVTIALSFFIGVLGWTLIEYLLHRFIFHFIAQQKWLEHLHYVVHGMHHAYPTDPRRVIFPPFASFILGCLLLVILLVLCPKPWVFGGMAGVIVGYCWYEFMHYASHHVKWRFAGLKRLKRHHLLHHHSEAFRDKNFGVTTSLWDRVFSTYLV